MVIKCSKCGKLFDEAKYDGICPKCARYNRASSASGIEHEMFHQKYDSGYSHSEQDDHQKYHDTYDDGYSHGEKDDHQRYHDNYDGGYTHESGQNETQGTVLNGETHSATGARNMENIPTKAQNAKRNSLLKIIIYFIVIWLAFQFLAGMFGFIL